MRGQERFEVARDDAPFAPKIDCPKLLQLDPVTGARLRHLNEVGNFLHGQQSSREHRAIRVCRLSCLHSGGEPKAIALTYINVR